MPVAGGRRSSGHTAKAVLVALVGVAVALGAAWGIAALSNQGTVQLDFGGQIFEAGQVENLSQRIADDRAPILYGSLTTGGRPVFVQHLGGTAESGWLAVGAFDPGDPDCLVDWSIEQQVFVNQCDPSVTYPPDGEGLRRYDTAVRDGVLRVDVAGHTTTTTGS
jgi:hypothetical protein